MARGHVYRRVLASGRLSRWHAVIDLPRPADGRRHQVTRTFDTRAQAESWLARTAIETSRPDHQAPTVGEFLTQWLDGHVYLRPSTRASYRAHIERHLAPAVGGVALAALSTAMIERLVFDLAARGLAPGSVQRVLATLRSALAHAVRAGLIPVSPAMGVRVPPRGATQIRTWTPDEAAAFLSSLRHSQPDVLLRLALTTGMRRGELLGLRWRHVDLSAGIIRVQAARVAVGGAVIEGPPKSRFGVRAVYLDEATRDALGLLRNGANALTSSDDHLVFVDEHGRGLSPWWVSRHFRQVVKGAGVPVIRFHDLRHTSATLGLAAGESLKEVSARLGHSGIAITADVYSQVLPASARASTAKRVGLMTGLGAAFTRGGEAA